MSRVVLLDSGPLGLVTNPRASAENEACRVWLETLLLKGVSVSIREIVDDEVRRELLRGGKVKGLQRLDQLIAVVGYLPITTVTMRRAAVFWARMRQQGKPTADDKALDGDVILAAQAAMLSDQGKEVVIATGNVGHLSRLVVALDWREIE